MKVWVIVNPAAGHGKAGKKAESLVGELRQRGVVTDVALSQYAGHVYELVNSMEDLSSYDGIVAIGGDGTLYEIINALMRHYGEIPLPLGHIPVGTGNSLSQDLYAEGARSAIEAIAEGRIRAIDMIEYDTGADPGFFTNMMGIGFVSEINARSNRYKALGMFAYALGVILEIPRLRTSKTTVRVDGEELQLESLFVELCNSRYTGGNMLLAPMAVVDDGKADILICKPMKRLRLLRVFPKVFNGSHLGLPEVVTLRGAEGEIVMDPPRMLSPDGEVLGTTPVRFRCLPKYLKIFA